VLHIDEDWANPGDDSIYMVASEAAWQKHFPDYRKLDRTLLNGRTSYNKSIVKARKAWDAMEDRSWLSPLLAQTTSEDDDYGDTPDPQAEEDEIAEFLMNTPHTMITMFANQ